MSYMTLYGFDTAGNIHEIATFDNSWRFAPTIWGKLEAVYLPPHIPAYIKELPWYHEGITIEAIRGHHISLSRVLCMCEENAMKQIWDLFDDPKVSREHRILLGSTFDYAVVRTEELPELTAAFRTSELALPQEMADVLDAHKDEYIAFAWEASLFAGCSWMCLGPVDDDGNGTPYNLLAGNEHFFLFDDLNGKETASDHTEL